MAETPSIVRAQDVLVLAEAEDRFWNEHWDELVQRYADQFVAVRGTEVVAVSGDLMQIPGLLKGRNLDLHDVSLRFIRSDWRRLAL